MARFNILTILLVCSVLVPLIAPQASSQTISTVTNMQSFTSSSVTTGFSTVLVTSTSVQSVRFDWTPYGYSERTGLFMLNQFKEMHGGGGMMNRGGDSSCLYYDYFLLNGVQGTEIKGHIEGGKGAPIIFYILNQDQLNRFNHSYCGWDDWTNAGWQVYALSASYDLDWVVPQNGEYALLFISPTWYYYDSISIYAKVYSTMVQSSMVSYTATKSYTVQSSQLIFLTQSSVTQQQPTVTSTNYYYAAALIAIMIALCIGFIIIRMKRRS
ncbi:MAG: hypothetical protein ABSF09_08165 [Candidatus Bathyarchaeia archaeon]